MKTLASALVAQKNTLAGTAEGGWLWLATLDRDGTNFLRYCAPASDDKVFDSQTYAAAEMEVAPPESDMGGSTKNFSITIQNVDQVLAADLKNGEFLDRPVLLDLVHTDHLASATNIIKVRGVVITASMKEDNVTFNCGAYDLRAVIVPKGTYSRERCGWVYKTDECGSVSGLSTCPKDLVACAARGVKERFGGFPGMPMLRP